MKTPADLMSGWCESGHHHRCGHRIQEANERHGAIDCACPCHTTPPISPAYTNCSRPWCLRGDVYHQAPAECMPVEQMARHMDECFGGPQ
jgi:hypothetical protein